ncbi:sensor histidine kinase [Deinococcus lacus]|uniref:histidine kinase n=1 Tax=Deinococcus lacus TaxID=392561 RepID=A0ABW1YD54_9DEIO
MRLEERTETLAERYSDLSAGLGERPNAPSNSYLALLNENGTVYLASPNMGLEPGAAFPHPAGDLTFQGSAIRAMTRPLSGFYQGKVLWSGLSRDTLLDAEQSARRSMWLTLLLTPLLTFALGWWIAQRMLSQLGRAAYLADHIDPSQSVAALDLPARPDEVHRLLAAINRLLVRIEAQQAREKQLLGQIVHELGAPLTVLKATLSRASERTEDPEVLKAALVADELTFTTQDLMQLARGKLEMKVVWHFIPARTLQGRLDRLVPDTDFRGDWSGMLLCDPDRLTQALRNLLANARRAAGPQGEVTLCLEESAEQVRFRVQDSGPGLPAELGEAIFEPFVSGSGSSGLGLSVSRQIAQLHGGELTGCNRPEGGAEFLLTLPGAALDSETEPEENGASVLA